MVVRLLAMSFAVALMGCQVNWNVGTSSPSSQPRFVDNTIFVRCRAVVTAPYTMIGKATPDKGEPNEFGVSVDGIEPNTCVVNWHFVRTTELGDIYDFTYGLRDPDGTCSHVQEKQVTYNGKEIVVFQTDFHQVGMSPCPTPATMPSDPPSKMVSVKQGRMSNYMATLSAPAMTASSATSAESARNAE